MPAGKRWVLPENRLLESLPSDVWQRIKTDLVPVDLVANSVIAERGSAFQDVYFPCGSMISVVVNFANRRTIEAELIGQDSYTGVAAVLGRHSAISDMLVQVAGPAYRIDRAAFQRHLQDNGLRMALGSHSALAYSNVAQLAGCIAFHSVDQRLARWLLMVRDAVGRDGFLLTQAFIGVMLGVPRQTVTNAVRVLERAGLIEHQRGFIRITDVSALEDISCECYAVMRARSQLA